jgi:putative oxidoreductase
MEQYLGRYEGQLYALFRIVAGLLFLCHGAQKALGLLGGVGGSGAPAATFSLYWFAGVIELVTGVLILIGWLTSWAAFLASGEMAVAYFMEHAPRAFLPIHNGGDLAALYVFAFLFLAARGSGPWSVDGLRRKPGDS